MKIKINDIVLYYTPIYSEYVKTVSDTKYAKHSRYTLYRHN